ncbi:MAG: lysylphosphatidylglycerol synthase domain-containing protein [Candidatus Saccharibacteria bacterium]
MGRYIPGTAPWILGKIYFASKHGISKQKLAVSSLLEGGLQIVTMLVFSLALLIFDKRLDVLGDGFKLLMVLVAIAGIVILIPSVFNRLVSKAYRLLRHKILPAEHLATSQTIIRGTALYLVDALINGVALFFIAKAVDPSLAYSNMVFAMGAASLAGAASMLAVFAPGGLGRARRHPAGAVRAHHAQGPGTGRHHRQPSVERRHRRHILRVVPRDRGQSLALGHLNSPLIPTP